MSDFMRIVSLCRELEASARTEIEAEHIRAAESREKQFFDSRPYYSREKDLSAWEKENQDSLTGTLENHVLIMSTVEKAFDTKVSGDPDEVIQNIEPADVRKIELSMGSIYRESDFAFNLIFNSEDGCKVVASGPTSDWVILVKGKLKGTLEQKRPWYRWLRLYQFSMPMFYIPLQCFVIWFYLFSGTHEKKVSDSSLALLLLSNFTTVPIAIFWLAVGLKKLIPAFALSAQGRPTRVALRIKRIGKILGWTITAVLIPLAFLYLN